ncbi:Uncharacterised protein [Nocardia brasiliensis]|nr:Uncharacterised protein [Nocardia brasiliensis]
MYADVEGGLFEDVGFEAFPVVVLDQALFSAVVRVGPLGDPFGGQWSWVLFVRFVLEVVDRCQEYQFVEGEVSVTQRVDFVL